MVRRETILESVWGFDCDVNENTLEAFVRLLRLKVDTREPKLIHTVRGVGYALRVPVMRDRIESAPFAFGSPFGTRWFSSPRSAFSADCSGCRCASAS